MYGYAVYKVWCKLEVRVMRYGVITLVQVQLSSGIGGSLTSTL